MAELGGLPLGIGSMPHAELEPACSIILKNFPDSPHWPELPRQDWRQSMGVEQARGLPGMVIDEEKGRVWFDQGADIALALGDFYERFLSGELESFAVSNKFLPGLGAMTELLGGLERRPAVYKGQLTGPTTLGLIFKDRDGRALLYNEQMMDVLVKATQRKAAWLAAEMAPFCTQTMVFFDEPMLQSIGSAGIQIDRSQAVARLRECVDGFPGITGGHCCGNTDWSILMEAGLDVIAFDAWHFADTMGIYGEQLVDFIENGGHIAWGVVPASAEGAEVSLDALKNKLYGGLEATAGKSGISVDKLVNQSFITPSCGLGSLTDDQAERILNKCAALAETMGSGL